MARLQKAAEAFKQLNQRKKGKKKGKKGPAGAGGGRGRRRRGAGRAGGRGWDGDRKGGRLHRAAGATRWHSDRASQPPAPPPVAEGVLTLRARPPSEAEFVDCFQKTKLAINLLVSPAAPLRPCPLCGHRGWGPPTRRVRQLLTGALSGPQAKLQKHIQNPSAAELVHFLFGPLDLVLGGRGRRGAGQRAGRGRRGAGPAGGRGSTCLPRGAAGPWCCGAGAGPGPPLNGLVPQIVSTCGGPDIARSVFSPLLSREAVSFLRGHLVPKEMGLWDSLGETWTRPRYSFGQGGLGVPGGAGSGSPWISHLSAEWPREPQVTLYVPRFHSGWEPPLDVLQEAPWEVEGPAKAPGDEVRRPPLPPQPPPPPTTATVPLPLPPPAAHRAQVAPFPTADPGQAVIPSELAEAQPCA